MKIKERIVVIVTLMVILSIAAYLIKEYNRPVSFNLVESFSDSTFSGKINFNFIEVNKYDEDELYEYASELSLENISLDLLRRDLPMITIVHFYKKGDTLKLDEKLSSQIKKQYPHIDAPSEKLQQVKDGYIYSSFSKRIDGINLPKDTIFQTAVIIPRNGIKAKDILKTVEAKPDTTITNDSLIHNNDSLMRNNIDGNN